MSKKQYIRVLTPEFTISYPNLVEPKIGLNPSQGPQYSCKMLFKKEGMNEKNLAAFKELRAAIKKAAVESFGEPLPKALWNPLIDGDSKDDPACAGHWTMNAKTKMRPGVVNAKLRELTEQEITELVYPGAVCRATILVSTFDGQGAKGVTCLLQNIQLLRDGERLIAKRDASSDFTATDDSDFGTEDGEEGW
jgi:hypothetical protein